jgi:hypothetical protein
MSRAIRRLAPGSAPRQFAHDHARAAADLEHALARRDRQRVEQSAHNAHIPRAAALVEAGDAAEQRAAEVYRAITRGQRWNQRLPLDLFRPSARWEQFEDRPSNCDAVVKGGLGRQKRTYQLLLKRNSEWIDSARRTMIHSINHYPCRSKKDSGGSF